MKKLFIVLLVTILLTGCVGVADWSYQLPNNFEIWRVNSNNIIIKNINTQKNVEEIPGFIKEFSYDSRYVFTRNIEDIANNNIFNEIYCILDTKENKVYGPFNSIEEFIGRANELDIQIPQTWYRTSPDPNTVHE